MFEKCCSANNNYTQSEGTFYVDWRGFRSKMDERGYKAETAFKIFTLITILFVSSVFTELKNEPSVVDESCKSSSCSCCASAICPNPGSDACSDGCKQGYHGGRCYNKCPDNCANCTDHPDADGTNFNGMAFCRECIDGYYSTPDLFQCQLKCGSFCVSCVSNGSCVLCMKGHCLSNGECRACPLGCNSCGLNCECYSCLDGYYLEPEETGQVLGSNRTNGICHHCPFGCTTCRSVTECLGCKSGYFLDEETPKGSTCQTCLDICSTCTSLNNCTSCIDGYYKPPNEGVCKACSRGCNSGICTFENGHCDCLENYDGKKCDVCIPGRYGDECQYICPENCANMSCDRDTGNCFSCQHNLVLPKCENCTTGLFGLDCNISCPENCLNSECERFTGHCFNCTENYAGLKCKYCSDWQYGDECDLTCPVNCFGTLCARYNGSCYTCMPGFAGSKCDKCMDGKYGAYCSFPCSENCANNLCNDRDGECFQCNKPEKYGKFCEVDCPKTCVNATCNRKTGHCEYGCIDWYSGDRCCLNNTFCAECIPQGKCSRCVNGKYGEYCGLSCNKGCTDNRCHKLDGICLGCDSGGNDLDCSDSDVQVAGTVIGCIGGITIVVTLSIIGLVKYKEKGI